MITHSVDAWSCLQKLLQISNFIEPVGDGAQLNQIHVQTLEAGLRRGKLQFVLPAFPAKSPNREKTVSARPDFGEYAAFVNLNRFCQILSEEFSVECELGR